MEEEEKIGFSNPKSFAPAEAKGREGRNKEKKTGLDRAAFIFFLLSLIVTLLAVCYFFLPLFSAVIALFVSLIVLFISLASIVFTIGIAFLSAEYLTWLGEIWQIPGWFFNVTEHISVLSAYYLIPGIACIIFNLIGITFAIIGVKAHKKVAVAYLVSSIVCLLASLLLLIVYLILGGVMIVD